jgi:hypothetical protein
LCRYERSPHNGTLRVALCSLYALIGAPSAAFSAFTQLDVKHIQLDTLTHHALPSLLGYLQEPRTNKSIRYIIHIK